MYTLINYFYRSHFGIGSNFGKNTISNMVNNSQCIICNQNVTFFEKPGQFAQTCDSYDCIRVHAESNISNKHDDIVVYTGSNNNYSDEEILSFTDRNIHCIICKKTRDCIGYPGFVNTCSSTQCMIEFDAIIEKSVRMFYKCNIAAKVGRFVCNTCDHTFFPNDGCTITEKCYDCIHYYELNSLEPGDECEIAKAG